VGIRDTLSKNQPLAIGIISVVIIGAIASIVWQAKSTEGKSAGAYFTVDDGKSLFVDKNTQMAPFTKDGKQAVRAHVFKCGGKEVVGYLSRLTADSIQVLEEAKAARGTGKPPKNVYKLASIGTSGTEVKKPGDPNWVTVASPTSGKIIGFRCPEGGSAQEVFPQ
jgi:hypothetical protein